MAKQGLGLNTLRPILKERSSATGWALCIGAGTSLPAFPSWPQLIECLIARDVGYPDAVALTSSLANSFSYDALIQAAQDRFGYSAQDFAKILSDELYAKIHRLLSRSEWQLFAGFLSATRLGDFKPSEWKAFLDLVRHHFSGISALPIAEVIAEVIDTDIAPASILSFNAEPLLATLIYASIAERIAPSIGKFPKRGELKSALDIVTHGISNRRADRIPYFFCHGLLPVPTPRHKHQTAQSVDKLVFSEGSYLQLANNAFSWQSTVFIDTCSSKVVVFVGLSLSDPNIRRWLSWIHANRIQELTERNAYRGVSTSHYWINKVPSSQAERAWIESSVAHLGIRLIWLDDWDKVGLALRKLLGL